MYVCVNKHQMWFAKEVRMATWEEECSSGNLRVGELDDVVDSLVSNDVMKEGDGRRSGDCFGLEGFEEEEGVVALVPAVRLVGCFLGGLSEKEKLKKEEKKERKKEEEKKGKKRF